MLLVVGSRHDRAAAALVARWRAHGAALLSCEDLSRPGWRYRPGDWAASRAVIDSETVPVAKIRGVLIRRPWILPLELPHIAAADRDYVAAEMNAFLLAFLSALPCTVLNRPRPTSLCGPNWRLQRWRHEALRSGFAVSTSRVSIPPRKRSRTDSGVAGEQGELTVLGETCFGAQDERTTAAAKGLAARARTTLLTIRFEKRRGAPRFIAANPMPELGGELLADAVRNHLLAEAGA